MKVMYLKKTNISEKHPLLKLFPKTKKTLQETCLEGFSNVLEVYLQDICKLLSLLPVPVLACTLKLPVAVLVYTHVAEP